MPKPVNGVWMCTPDSIHNTYGIQIFNDEDPAIVEKFERLCLDRFMHDKVNQVSFGTFFQGGHGTENWRYFEFLRTNPDTSVGLQYLILSLCEEIATELGLELEIDLN